MASRTLPGLGLKGDWALGEDGYKDEMDTNLLWASVILGGRVDDIVAAVPGSPAEGDIVILDEDHGVHPNELATYDEGAWKYRAVPIGTILFNEAGGRHVVFTADDLWTEFKPNPAPAVVAVDADDYTVLAADEGKYIRLTDAAAKDVIVPDEATGGALPENGEWHIRNVGAGDATIDDSDVTINLPVAGSLVIEQGGTVTLKRVDVDEFDLIGVTVAA